MQAREDIPKSCLFYLFHFFKGTKQSHGCQHGDPIEKRRTENITRKPYPNIEIQIFVRHTFDVKSDCRHSCNNLPNLLGNKIELDTCVDYVYYVSMVFFCPFTFSLYSKVVFPALSYGDEKNNGLARHYPKTSSRLKYRIKSGRSQEQLI